MTSNNPVTELHAEYSSTDASPISWEVGAARLADAEIYWLTTVRPDGRPHVTPLIGIWWRNAMYFCTGPDERKARNLEGNRNCVLTTGTNAQNQGLDIVVEGRVELVSDELTLEGVADAYAAKYPGWIFTEPDGTLHGKGSGAIMFRVASEKAFGFSRGSSFGQTRWRF